MFRNILVAIDGSPSAQRALAQAIDLAEALHARLTIVTIAPEVPGFAASAGLDVGALEAAAEDDTVKRLREATDLVPQTVSVTTVLRHGNAARAILKVAAEGDHDLIVMGSRGRGRLASNVLGSVTADVHFGTTLPMLVIHPKHHE